MMSGLCKVVKSELQNSGEPLKVNREIQNTDTDSSGHLYFGSLNFIAVPAFYL